jgi:trimeric autotransporter adhesin
VKQVESSTGGTPSDAELILQVRSGDRDAFGVLYERHAGAARALARQYVSPADAEDVVADAFSKLFEMLRRGAGPDAGFRTYLYTVVRHRSFDVSRGAARTRPTTDDEIESVLGRVASEEDPALAGFERSVVSKAYFDLPERWREVLWYVLVDDLKPAQVAPALGLSANGVSALLYRAKEALRAGYLQQHLTHAPSDMCRTVNPLLGGYVRESLSKRETAKINDHLATCGTCSALVLELHDVAHGMKTVIAPLVLGAGGLALVGAGVPIGGLAVAAKAGAGAGAAAGGAPAATVTVASTSTLSGAVSSAVSATAGALASAAAAATGGSMAAGAIAVAAVGIVAALQIATPADDDPLIDTVIAVSDGRELPGTEGVNGDSVQPTDIGPGANTTYFDVDYTDAAQPLTPRETQNLSLTVKNTSSTETTGTQLEISLPPGLGVAKPNGPFGTGVGGRLVPLSAGTADASEEGGAQDASTSSPSTVPPSGSGTSDASDAGKAQAQPSATPSAPADRGSMPTEGPAACTPTEQDRVLLCSVGELAPGATHEVVVPVEANSGGDYPVGARVWADGIAPVGLTLPGRTVAPFGPELTAQTEDVSLASPGTAALPVRVGSTGDRTVPAGWSVRVTLPDGVAPASAQPELSCDPGAELPNAWNCAPRAGTDGAAVTLDPGATVGMTLNITTAEATSEEPTVLGAANITPVLDGSARSASATLVGTSAWAGAEDGVGEVATTCLAKGGVGEANAAVTGSYTNTTQRTVRVALEAAGGNASSGKDLAPGDVTRLTVPDGLRVPAGQAVFVVATEVDGHTYKTRVTAGEHGREDCYSPRWATDTSVETVYAGGTVGVEGTVTNQSDESLTAVMSVPVGDTTMESVSRVVAPGGEVTLSVITERTELPEGDVTFRLSRDGVDTDGDQPSGPVVPDVQPTAHHDGAVIAPANGQPMKVAGACEFDAAQDHSVRMFAVTADNRDSTLPVPFHVAGMTRTVPAGEAELIEFPVVWGTGTATLTAVGKTLAERDVSFESCAELTWPTTEHMSVDAAAQCVDMHTHLTAAVENRTGHDWTGVLVDDGSGDKGPDKPVPAGETTTLELERDTAISSEGNVTVRLTRQLEGAAHTVERSFAVDGTLCLPDAECETEPTSFSTPATTDAEQLPLLNDPCDDEAASDAEASSGDSTADASDAVYVAGASDDAVETVARVTKTGHDIGSFIKALVNGGNHH